MPECKHEAHCQFEGLSPCYPCRSESPRTCIVVSLFTEALRRTVHRTGHRMQSMSLRKDCLVTPHALFRCSVTPSAHTTVCLVMSASQGRWKRGYWERAWFPSVESAGYTYLTRFDLREIQFVVLSFILFKTILIYFLQLHFTSKDGGTMYSSNPLRNC